MAGWESWRGLVARQDDQGGYRQGDGQLVAEVVVTDAGEGDEGTAGESCRGELVLGLVAVVHQADHPLLPADPDKLSGLWHVRIP